MYKKEQVGFLKITSEQLMKSLKFLCYLLIKLKKKLKKNPLTGSIRFGSNIKMAYIEKCQCGGFRVPMKCKCGGRAIGYVDTIKKNPDISPVSLHIYCCEYCRQPHGDNFIKFGEGYYCDLVTEPCHYHDQTKELKKQCDICCKLLVNVNDNAYLHKKCPKCEGDFKMRHVYILAAREDLDLCRLCCLKHGGSSENKKCNYIDFHKETNMCLDNMVKRCHKLERKVPQLKKKIEGERTKRELVQLELAKERIRTEWIKEEYSALKAKFDKLDD